MEVGLELLEIQRLFSDQIEALESVNYDVLDVKASRWHHDYDAFRAEMKTLENRYMTAINTAMAGALSSADAHPLLELFGGLATRSAIKQHVEKKTSETYLLFVRELDRTRKEIDENRAKPPLRVNEPQYAGAALWAHQHAAWMTATWDVLDRSKYVTAPLLPVVLLLPHSYTL